MFAPVFARLTVSRGAVMRGSAGECGDSEASGVRTVVWSALSAPGDDVGSGCGAPAVPELSHFPFLAK